MRRSLLVLIAVLAVPAAASAQAGSNPVDDATAARLFADAALRAQPALFEASEQLEAISGTSRCEARLLRYRRARVRELVTSFRVAHTIARFARTVGPTLTTLSNELHGVETTDAVLRSGRTGWRRTRRAYARFASLPAGNVCAQVRAYIRNGNRHTRETRRVRLAYLDLMAWEADDIDRRLLAAVERMVALGVPVSDADAFSGFAA